MEHGLNPKPANQHTLAQCWCFHLLPFKENWRTEVLFHLKSDVTNTKWASSSSLRNSFPALGADLTDSFSIGKSDGSALSTVIAVKAQLRCCSWPKDSCSSRHIMNRVISFLSLCKSQNATGSVRFGFLLLKDFSIIFTHLQRRKTEFLLWNLGRVPSWLKCALNRWMGAHVMSHVLPFLDRCCRYLCIPTLFPSLIH